MRRGVFFGFFVGLRRGVFVDFLDDFGRFAPRLIFFVGREFRLEIVEAFVLFFFAAFDRFASPFARFGEVAEFRVRRRERAQNVRFGVKRDFASGNGHFESALAVAEFFVRAGREEPSVIVEDAGVGRVQFEDSFVNFGGFFPMTEHKFHIGEGSEEVDRFRVLFEFVVQHFQRGLVKALFGGRVSDLSDGDVFMIDVASQLLENANRVVVFLHLEVDNAFEASRRRDVHS